MRGGPALAEALAPLLGTDAQLPGHGSGPAPGAGSGPAPGAGSGSAPGASRSACCLACRAPPRVPHTRVSRCLSGIIWKDYVEMENVHSFDSAVPLL